jgi:flagellar basal-body rod protein FlgF
MENTIYVALSRQMALRSHMDIIANNVANMSTSGYRAQNMVFTEFVEKADREDATKDDLSFVLDYGHYQNTQAGPLKQTGNDLNAAIQGPGYFGIQTPEGVMYTRNGDFQLNANGELSTGNGYLVADDGGGTLTVPRDASRIFISEDGALSTDEGEVGRLMVVEFENVQQLEAMGNGLYKTEAPTIEAENSRVKQGMLEGSNVNPVLEMTRMIDVLRSYQSTQNMLNGEHDRQRTMIRQLSNPSG